MTSDIANAALVLAVEDKDTSESEMLDGVRLLTTMMREHQAAVVRLGKQRRRLVRKLRELRVPYKTLADSMGVTDQAVFADLRKHPEAK
jgi:hypothetical protein